jgi:hypothetical protein
MNLPALRVVGLALLAVLITAGITPLWAQTPPINIDLTFDQPTYEIGEQIGVTVTVTSESGNPLLINEGFGATDFYLEMRVVDPAKRLLVGKREEFHDEFPDAPPLRFVAYKGRPIRVAACEVLNQGWQKISSTSDLRQHYDISLPGYYSAQVQVSAMTYPYVGGSVSCSPDDYSWQGLLKSQTVYFYVTGSAAQQVKVSPDQWKISWLTDKKAPDIQVQIVPEDKKLTDSYDLESIRMNGVVATGIKVSKPKIKAYFNARDSLESLTGGLTQGEQYKVIISGRLKSGSPFGGETKIRIVK